MRDASHSRSPAIYYLLHERGLRLFAEAPRNLIPLRQPVRPGGTRLRKLRLGIALLVCFSRSARAGAQEAPPSPPLEAKISAGVHDLQSGDLDSAEGVFSNLLKQGIKHPLVYHNLGVIALLRGNYPQAATRLRQALALQPQNGSSRLLLGISLLALSKNAEAVQELKRAATLLPEEPQAHLQLARAYEAMENWILAVRELQRAVHLAPQDPEYAYQLCKAWTRLSDWAVRRIVALNPNSPRLDQGLGMELAAQRKYEKALAAYRQAVQSDPKMPEIHLAMAQIWLEMKKFDEALSEVSLELQLVPESKLAADTKAKIEAAKAGLFP